MSTIVTTLMTEPRPTMENPIRKDCLIRGTNRQQAQAISPQDHAMKAIIMS